MSKTGSKIPAPGGVWSWEKCWNLEDSDTVVTSIDGLWLASVRPEWREDAPCEMVRCHRPQLQEKKVGSVAGLGEIGEIDRDFTLPA